MLSINSHEALFLLVVIIFWSLILIAIVGQSLIIAMDYIFNKLEQRKREKVLNGIQ